MDTKSRSFSHSKILKVIAFTLVVASFTSMVLLGFSTLNNPTVDVFDNPFEDNYYSSGDYNMKIHEISTDLIDLAVKYKNEEYIKAGNSINKEELKYEKEKLFQDFTESDKYNEQLSYQENYKKFQSIYEEDYKKELESTKNRLIRQDLTNFRNIKSKLVQMKGLIYYVKKDENIFTNTKENSINDFKKYPAYIVSDENEYSVYPKEFTKQGNLSDQFSKVDKIEIAFTKDYIDQNISDWEQSRELIKDAMYKMIVLISVLLLSLLYLFIVIGKRRFKHKQVEISSIDKIYTDINFISIFSIIGIWAVIVTDITQNLTYKASFILIGVVSAISCTIVLFLLLSLVRHIKDRTIIKHSVIFIVINKIYELVKDIYDSGNVAIKVAVAVIVYPIVAALSVFFFPIIIALAVWYTHRKVKDYQSIKSGVKKIKNGEVDHKIYIEKEGEFKNLAENINSIGEGFNSAIDNELKSERLKTELITNVSHDIRTPLTSIITYIDLIKREDDLEKLKGYVEVLEQKSNRLKILTDDLFEASKASSGNIPVNYEKIDIVSLVTQGLGELDSQVKESRLDFKITKTDAKMYVKADGRLLWRSIENLLTNIFKYSLKRSRVYIDILDIRDEVEINMKNISSYELNISSDELMERFKRGDDSRSSEGSGLGLSISKSLIEAQGGSFEILIDGDLFKVRIKLPKFK